jgi:hypothetical protein
MSPSCIKHRLRVFGDPHELTQLLASIRPDKQPPEHEFDSNVIDFQRVWPPPSEEELSSVEQARTRSFFHRGLAYVQDWFQPPWQRQIAWKYDNWGCTDVWTSGPASKEVQILADGVELRFDTLSGDGRGALMRLSAQHARLAFRDHSCGEHESRCSTIVLVLQQGIIVEEKACEDEPDSDEENEGSSSDQENP